MNRKEKEDVVSELGQKLQSAKVSVLAQYQGLSVEKTNQLRRELRAARGECRVAKNTLARIALKEISAPTAEPWLDGQTALVFGYEDPVAVTKIVARWADVEVGKFSIKGALFEGSPLEPAGVVALSKTPSKEVLRAQLLGVLLAPASRLVRTLAEPGAQLARVLAAHKDSIS